MSTEDKALRAAFKHAIEEFRQMEWYEMPSMPGVYVCTHCYRRKNEGHDPECPMGKMLSEVNHET